MRRQLAFGRAISGITSSSISTVFAYIADVTPPEKRAGAFGMIGMALAIGVTLLTLGTTGALDTVTLALIAGGVIVGGGAAGIGAARRLAGETA